MLMTGNNRAKVGSITLASDDSNAVKARSKFFLSRSSTGLHESCLEHILELVLYYAILRSQCLDRVGRLCIFYLQISH